MRAHEFITEAARGSVPDDLKDKSQGSVKLTRDVGGYDRFYHMNRLMMAMAMSDGGRGPVGMDAASWYEKYNIMFPYTDLEAAMVNQAIATIPTDTKGVIAKGKSVENPGTHKISPVARPKRNRWGV